MAKFYQAMYKEFDMENLKHLANVLKLNLKGKIKNFSKGMKRQCALICAISTNADYMFFDETFDGIDPVVRNLLKQIIRKQMEKKTTTIIMTSHNLRELEDICDNLGLLYKGGILFESEINSIKTSMIKVQIIFQDEFDESKLDDLEIIGANNLKEVALYLNNEFNIEPEKIDIEQIFSTSKKYVLDFSDVKGQENIKRALEVSAAGGHNCLLVGTPGSGKTMMARRIPSILPDLTFDEALEITKIHSVAGVLTKNTSIKTERPYRSPHHTISITSLVGGGRIPKPGEISLAHYGVLFLDELPEFNKNTLEVLRGPLEDRTVTISRVNASLTYPCNFMLVGSMNPCPCGFYGSKEKECTCSNQAIAKYMGKISGPLLDRIDIQIEVSPVKYDKLQNDEKIESSQEIKERVNKARKIQIERYKDYGIFSNSELNPKLIEKYCKLGEKEKKILQDAFEKLGLSARAHGRILKVARTIADLDEKETIETKHIAEAIQYRSLDRKYWKN